MREYGTITSPEPFEISTAFRREIGGIKIKFSCPIRFPIGQTLAMTDKPVKAMDLTQLSDEELEALADRVDEGQE